MCDRQHGLRSLPIGRPSYKSKAGHVAGNKVKKRSRGIAVVLTPALDGGEGVLSVTLRPIYPQEKDTSPIAQVIKAYTGSSKKMDGN